MAIFADCESKRRARKKWRQSEKGKAWDKAYSRRMNVRMKRHEYYIERMIREASNEKLNRESQKIHDLHEEWALKNGYRDNENLHATNAEGFINYERRKEETQQ